MKKLFILFMMILFPIFLRSEAKICCQCQQIINSLDLEHISESNEYNPIYWEKMTKEQYNIFKRGQFSTIVELHKKYDGYFYDVK